MEEQDVEDDDANVRDWCDFSRLVLADVKFDE
jgi:hypothetical protein